MSLLSRVKTWVDGDVLTAADLNAEFNNIIDTGLDPTYIEDESTDKTAMRVTVDPYPTATPSLPTTLAGELQRMRYVISQITGETYWYIDPDISLADMDDHSARHESGGADAIQIDNLAAASDNTDLDVTTTAHGLAPKVTAPATGYRNILAIDNAETTLKPIGLFSATETPTDATWSDTSSAGTSKKAARIDHTHGFPTNISPFGAVSTPEAQDFADTGTVGSSNLFARQDHQHPMMSVPAGVATPEALDFAETGTVGTSDLFARSDHVHPMMAVPAGGAKITTQAFGDTVSSGTSDLFARQDHKHAMMALPAGTELPAAQVFGDTGTKGASDLFARSDHKHPMMDGTKYAATDGITTIGHNNAATLGTSLYWARKDHKHKFVATLDLLFAPTDSTKNNVTTSAHGLCPKGDNSALHALLGNLSWGHPDADTWDGAHKFVSSTLPATSDGATNDLWFQYEA